MPRIVIAGCGFVGKAVARAFHATDWEVFGITHSSESASALASEPYAVVQCDISNPDSIRAHAAPAMLEPDAVIHCASSGRGGADAYRSVYLQGARNLLHALAPRQLLFTGSTSVYAQTDGGWVTEESPAEPPRETGRILRETEDLILSRGGIVARLAGIYGPDRSVLLRKFFCDEAVIEDGGHRFVNQVARDDIASALLLLIKSGAHGIWNVCDNLPLAQKDIYEWLASRFDKPVPPSGPIDLNRKRGWTNKRVSNAKLRALGWTPEFPDFFHAVTHCPELVARARMPTG